MAKPPYREALARSGVIEALADFDPHVAGTPPLGIDLPSSDLDILCHASDADRFMHAIWSAFADCPDFSIRQWTDSDRPVIATFACAGWPFEIFGQARPVRQQYGWRHFCMERRLLALGGAPFRAAIIAARGRGIKTEPAFAQVLGLPGDPYRALLDLEKHSDAELAQLLMQAGYQYLMP